MPTIWQIKALVYKKGKIVPHAKGQLFKVDLIDTLDKKAMIEAIFYTEETTFFYNQIDEGKVYIISNPEVSTANKRFTTLKHNYRLIIKMDTEFKEVDPAHVIQS